LQIRSSCFVDYDFSNLAWAKHAGGVVVPPGGGSNGGHAIAADSLGKIIATGEYIKQI